MQPAARRTARACAARLVSPTPAPAAAQSTPRRPAARLARRLQSGSAATKLPSATSLSGSEAVQQAARLEQDPVTGEQTGTQRLDASRLVIERNPAPKQVPDAASLAWGRTFTDHMLIAPWNAERGWEAPRIVPYGPFSLDPSSTVLHYAPTLFEGLKAYRDADGAVRLFRPQENFKRMQRSAARLGFPQLDEGALLEMLKQLVSLDKGWIPSEPGYALYIRPTMIGTQAALGVGPSSDVLLFVILSPVGPYYKNGFKPVRLLATTQHVRACPGGTGGYKLGSNYAGGVVPQIQAAQLGYDQILWLYGDEHEITEVGTMNLFAVLRSADGGLEVVTPPLGNTILPGITRMSALSLLRDHAEGRARLPGLPDWLTVSERRLTMADIQRGASDGTLAEMFGTGTAAVVSPVKNIGFEGQSIDVPVGADGLGDVARAVLQRLDAIQTGRVESDWAVLCP